MISLIATTVLGGAPIYVCEAALEMQQQQEARLLKERQEIQERDLRAALHATNTIKNAPVPAGEKRPHQWTTLVHSMLDSSYKFVPRDLGQLASFCPTEAGRYTDCVNIIRRLPGRDLMLWEAQNFAPSHFDLPKYEKDDTAHREERHLRKGARALVRVGSSVVSAQIASAHAHRQAALHRRMATLLAVTGGLTTFVVSKMTWAAPNPTAGVCLAAVCGVTLVASSLLELRSASVCSDLEDECTRTLRAAENMLSHHQRLESYDVWQFQKESKALRVVTEKTFTRAYELGGLGGWKYQLATSWSIGEWFKANAGVICQRPEYYKRLGLTTGNSIVRCYLEYNDDRWCYETDELREILLECTQKSKQ